MRAFALFAAALLLSGCSIISAFYSKEKKFELAGLGQDGVYRTSDGSVDTLIKIMSARTKEGEPYRIIHTLEIPKNSTQTDFDSNNKEVFKIDCSKNRCSPEYDREPKRIAISWPAPNGGGVFDGVIYLKNLRLVKAY